MGGTGIMLWRMWRAGRQGLRHYLFREPAQGLAFFGVIVVVWLVILMILNSALWFLSQEAFITFKPRLIEAVTGLFFFALFFLMCISDMVVTWTALFRSESAVYQGQLPLSNRSLYWSAFSEGGLWSGWALLVLAVPILIALSGEAVQQYLYLPAAALSFLTFFLCCMATGGFCAIILGRLIPYARKSWKGIVALVVLVIAFLIFILLGAYDGRGQPDNFMREVIGKLSFTENPMLPPAWAQQALYSASQSRWGDWFYYIILMLSFAVMLSMVGEWIAVRRLRVDIDQLLGRPDSAKKSRSKAWKTLPIFNKQIGILIAKDFRLFVRDPAQVMQFGMFFGLLSLYILMLPRISQAFAFSETWKPVVSLLNLSAISMAMATFTGRFVYPMLSLEGKRLWVLMLAPWQPERIVTAKFIFACLVAIPISVLLVSSSGYLLELDAATIIYEMFVTICLGLGLSASALGTGARLADYKEDNPAKLVAGYGGTINLLASISFCGVILLGASIPVVNGDSQLAWILGISWTLILSTIWLSYGIYMAQYWFTRQVWQCTPGVHAQAQEKRGTRYRSLIVVKAILVSAFLYVLSYGPALYIWQELEWSQRKFDRLYMPIQWLQEHTPLGPSIEWYVSLFV